MPNRKRSGMRKRKYLIGATLGVLGALVVSGTAFAGSPTSQTLQTTVAPKKLPKKTFKGVSLHNIISTTYSNFTGSPGAKETKFTIDKQIKFVNGNTPACSQATLQASTSTSAVQSQCGSSIVGSGTAEVNNRTGFFPSQDPVLLVSGGPTTLYVWVRLEGAQTLVLIGAYNKGPNTLDVTNLPNIPGGDLTKFDTTFTKKKTGKSSFYVMARCKSKKKKMLNSETTTFQNNATLTASSTQKCKATA